MMPTSPRFIIIYHCRSFLAEFNEEEGRQFHLMRKVQGSHFLICILEGDSILEKRFHAQLNGRVVGKIVKADFTYPFTHLSLGSIISIKSSGSVALE